MYLFLAGFYSLNQWSLTPTMITMVNPPVGLPLDGTLIITNFHQSAILPVSYDYYYITDKQWCKTSVQPMGILAKNSILDLNVTVYRFCRVNMWLLRRCSVSNTFLVIDIILNIPFQITILLHVNLYILMFYYFHSK